MGYYTDFHFKINLRKDTPAEIIRFLHWKVVLQKDDSTGFIPDHAFFKLEGWEHLFYISGLLSDEKQVPQFFEAPNGYHTLILHGSINHGFYEIQEFVNWISPYVAGRKKRQFLGWSQGEDWHDSPQLNHYRMNKQ